MGWKTELAGIDETIWGQIHRGQTSHAGPTGPAHHHADTCICMSLHQTNPAQCFHCIANTPHHTCYRTKGGTHYTQHQPAYHGGMTHAHFTDQQGRGGHATTLNQACVTHPMFPSVMAPCRAHKGNSKMHTKVASGGTAAKPLFVLRMALIRVGHP